MEVNNSLPTPKVWDEVANDYSIEIIQSEEKLANEIIKILGDMGIKKGAKLLELGSGSGHLSATLAMQGYSVTLLDFSQNALEKSKQTFEKYDLEGTFIKGDLMDLPNLEAEYDLVWNSGVMEHFNDVQLKKIFTCINKTIKGKFLFIVPNYRSLPYLIYRYKLISEGLWNVGKEYLRKDYNKLIEESGFKVVNEYFLGSEFTKKHMEVVYGLNNNLDYFNDICDKNLMPIEEKYLVGYLAVSSDEFNLSKDYSKISNAEYESTFFDLTANITGIRNLYDKYITEKNKTIECLSNEKNNINRTVEELKNHIEKLENEKNKNEQQENEINTLKNKIEENIKSISSKNGEILRFEKAIDLAINKLKEISMLKPYRMAHVIRRVKHQYKNGSEKEKKEFKLWAKNKILRKSNEECHTYDPLFEVINILNNHKKIDSMILNNIHFNERTDINKDSMFLKEYTRKSSIYNEFLSSEFSDETKELIEIIENKQYKGIVVYPEAFFWEPVQRPQNFLRELAKRGFLCFYCEPFQDKLNIDEKEENLFVINNESYLLEALKSKNVIVLCSWLGQMSWADFIPNKFIWYDVLDQLEYSGYYDEMYLNMHNEMLKKADFVTYSAHLLKKYVSTQEKAVYLPNAVNCDDFFKINTEQADIILKAKDKGHKIIGYYGAIEDWFKKNLIKELAEKHSDWEFILIGPIGIEIKDILQENVHFTGKVPYKDLRKYADYFDVAVIPFIKNDLTDCVSPVKFFEYAAMGLPVVSTPISEMHQYECEWMQLADSTEEFEKAIELSFSNKIKDMAKEQGIKLAQDNQWEHRIDLFIQELSNNINGWKAYSNLRFNNSIFAYAETFLDFEGNNFYAGGAERYLIDLGEICGKNGINFNICQYGNYPWVRKFKGLNVISLGNKELNAKNLSLIERYRFNRNFYDLSQYRAELAIYSPFFIGTPFSVKPNIGISHGISWDNKLNNYNNGNDFWNDKKVFIESACKLDNIVSVDTNTANWFQTINFNTSKKIKVIPNYVDLDEFKPIDKEENDKIVITYPRRLYEARGLYLVLSIVDKILKNHPNVEFHFIGRGFEEDTKYVKEKVDKWDGRVKWYSLLPEEMPKVYEISDITLIPTLYSEGTSLSCLEAMAAGNVIIATRVGGLTDLIIDGFNGCLIGLNEEELLESVERLISDNELRNEFSENSIRMAKAFSKEKWNLKWEKVIKQVIGETKINTLEDQKHIKIYIKNKNILSETKVKNKIIDLLNQDAFVEIRVDDDYLVKNMSFGRIQFVNWNVESLYVNPNLIMADSEAAQQLNCKVDIVLE